MTELSFADASYRVSQAMVFDGASPDTRDYEIVRSALIRVIMVRYRALGTGELLDIVDEAVARMLRESRRQGHALNAPAGWLVTVATNLARDRLRRLGREAELVMEPAADDDVARMIDANATHDALQRAMDQAIAQGDWVAVRVVTVWLDEAHERGVEPSSRLVGEQCGVSHTTVNKALARFRSYIDELRLL